MEYMTYPLDYSSTTAVPTQREARRGSLAVPMFLFCIGGFSLAGGLAGLHDGIRERMAFDSGTREVDAEVTGVTKWSRRTGSVYEVRYRFDAALFDHPPSTFYGDRTVSAAEQRRNNYKQGRRASVIYATQQPTISRLTAEGLPKTGDFVLAGITTIAGLALVYLAWATRKSSLRDINLAKELDDAGLDTQGQVISVTPQRYRGYGHLTHCDLEYRFFVGGKMFRVLGQKVGREALNSMTMGQALQVRYLARDPRVSRAE